MELRRALLVCRTRRFTNNCGNEKEKKLQFFSQDIHKFDTILLSEEKKSRQFFFISIVCDILVGVEAEEEAIEK